MMQIILTGWKFFVVIGAHLDRRPLEGAKSPHIYAGVSLKWRMSKVKTDID